MRNAPARRTLSLALLCLGLLGLRAPLFAQGTAPPAAGTLEGEKDPLQAQPTDDETTRKLKEHFREALKHLDLKRPKEAIQELQQALALKPNSEVIAVLYRQAILKFIEAAIESKDPELKTLAEEFQKLALKGRIQQLRSPAYIKARVEQVRDGGFLERMRAMEELIAAGDYAVPYVVQMIAETDKPDRRGYGGYVLSQLRGTAVPAICEALKIRDPMVRQILLQALESIADARSLPWLLWLAQEPDGHPLVVAAARQAIAKTTDDPALRQTPTPKAFLDLAERYYFEDPRVLLPHLYEHLVWRYDPDEKMLKLESVPRGLYPYRVAEELCRNALLADRTFEPAIPMLLCAYFAQQSELDAFFAAIEGKDAQTLTKEEKEAAALAQPIRERLQAAPLVAHAAGKKFVYAALRRALRDGKSEIALSCIHALRDVADGSALPKPPVPEDEAARRKKKGKGEPEAKPKGPRIMTWFGPEERKGPEAPPAPPVPFAVPLDGSPLVDALGYPDRRVRYAAAEAIVAISPKHLIRDADKVMSNLSDALSETAFHVALVVDEDEVAAEELRPLLQDVGVVPIPAQSQRDALTRAVEVPPKDLLILSGALKQVGVVQMLANLRRIDKVAGIPALVITTKSELPDMRLRFAEAKEQVTFLTRPYVAETVRAAVHELLKKTPEPKGKSIAARYASSAARTLAMIEPATSIFKLEDALPALLRALASRTQPDSVRVPCCEAIQRTASQRALPYLIETYNDPESSKELRLAVLDALGTCSAPLDKLPPEVAVILTRVSYADDIDYRRAAARAFGLRGGAEGDFLEVVDHLHGKKPKEEPK